MDIMASIDSETRICADLSGETLGARPPKIFGHCPDVYGFNDRTGRVYIGEAKTYDDLNTDRSQSQILSFVKHVNRDPVGLFILGGSYNTAVRAKTCLRFLVQENSFDKRSVMIFDGFECWMLSDSEEAIWALC